MKFSDNFIRNLNKLKFSAEKNSPEILIGIGIAAFGATVYYTVRGTVTASEALSCLPEDSDSTDDDNEAQNRSQKLATVSTMVKAYTPAVVCGSVALASFLGSNHMLRNRALSVAAAYATLETGFSEYRKRVIEKYGDDIDRELKYGIVQKKVKTTEVDPETGKKTKKTETVETIENCGPFGVYFKRSYEVKKTGKTIVNPNWQNNELFNLTFINAQLAWFNDRIALGERVYLSEVFEILGIPVDDYPDSRVVGWLPKKGETSDNYIRFNAYEPPYSKNYIVNPDCEVLLDFNTDGVILYK